MELLSLLRPFFVSGRIASALASSCAVLLNDTTSSWSEFLGSRRASCAKCNGTATARFRRRKLMRRDRRGVNVDRGVTMAMGRGSSPRDEPTNGQRPPMAWVRGCEDVMDACALYKLNMPMMVTSVVRSVARSRRVIIYARGGRIHMRKSGARSRDCIEDIPNKSKQEKDQK